jgi:hypothetical protein
MLPKPSQPLAILRNEPFFSSITSRIFGLAVPLANAVHCSLSWNETRSARGPQAVRSDRGTVGKANPQQHWLSRALARRKSLCTASLWTESTIDRIVTARPRHTGTIVAEVTPTGLDSYQITFIAN